MRILLVEDEPKAAQMLAKGLRNQGYSVDIASKSEEALYKVAVNTYDLMILDLVLPGQDGFSICRTVRATGHSLPILILTARDSVQDRVKGLDTGADDYLTKPYEYSELLARIRALLRRGSTTYTECIQVGDLRIDIGARSVTRCEQKISLTAKEYAILEYLGRKSGKLVSREELSEHAWDENFDAFSNVIDVYILRLRRKIDSGYDNKLLRTRRGEGYALISET
jgi:two-component system, OmpR family, copper resistance phosphate regulon response regulator CusR